MKIKKEVRDLCLALIDAHKNKDTNKFIEIKGKLQEQYKFTPFSLLALFYSPPIIEYNENNYHLIMEE